MRPIDYQVENLLARRHTASLRAILRYPGTYSPVTIEAARRIVARRDARYAQCDATCTVDCGACKGGGPVLSYLHTRS